MRVWLDTDIGSDVDDALALAYVLRHPDLELVGISTVFGDLAVRGAITNALLQIERELSPSAGEPIPVLAGLGVPLTPRKRGIMFGHEGIGLLDDPQPTLRLSEEVDGANAANRRVEHLGEAIDAAAPVTIVAIGPLTNLGALAARGFTFPRLAVMGGKLSDVLLEDMTAEIPEWNWFCDPTAVVNVLGAHHEEPPLIVPAEVTFKTRFEEADLDRLAEGDTLTRQLAVLCEYWLALQRDDFGRRNPRVALHDPLTVALLVEPSLCEYRPRSIAVDDRGGASDYQRGCTVLAAADVTADAARRHIIDVIMGGR